MTACLDRIVIFIEILFQEDILLGQLSVLSGNDLKAKSELFQYMFVLHEYCFSSTDSLYFLATAKCQ